MREAAHSHLAVGNRSLFLPGGDRGAASCSPLEGDCRLRAGKTTQPGPQGSGFFLSAVLLGENRRALSFLVESESGSTFCLSMIVSGRAPSRGPIATHRTS